MHLFLANTYQVISEGALEAAITISRERDAPLAGSGVARLSDDPFVLRRIGDLWTQVAAGGALVDHAAVMMEAAMAKAHELPLSERAAAYSAKVAAAGFDLTATSEILELTGARATTAQLALDRFWRNLRVHSLHDPLDLRLRDVGRFVLTGKGFAVAPDP